MNKIALSSEVTHALELEVSAVSRLHARASRGVSSTTLQNVKYVLSAGRH